MKKIFIIFFFLFTLFIRIDGFADSNFGFFVTMERERFFHNDSLFVKMVVTNNSNVAKNFVIFDRGQNSIDYLTFQPVIFDMVGRKAELIVPYRLEGKKLKTILKGLSKRTILLQPNEQFVHKIDLRKIYNIKNDKKYRVKAFLFPNLEKKIVVRSQNELIFVSTSRDKIVLKSGIEKIKHEILPIETVHLMLFAEKRRDWENFIRFIDTKKYLNSYPDFVKRYKLADKKDRFVIIKEFKNFLFRQRADYILNFNVYSSELSHSGKIAYVEAKVERFGIRKNENYKYRFKLEKWKKFWLITKIDATVTKGIKHD